jgi:predicted RNA binding protein YcfA (HicA-like mRNA interferase family)
MGKHNSGQHYISLAEQNGLRTENGKGSHVKVYGPTGRGYMCVPMHKELSPGVECAVKKWFRALGILLVVVSPVACLATAMFMFWLGG